MKIIELPGYLGHELMSYRYGNVITAIEPFIEFAAKAGQMDLYRALTKIKTKAEKNFLNTDDVSELSSLINTSCLGALEPDFLSREVEVYHILNDSNKKIAGLIENKLIREVLEKALKSVHNVVRSYSEDIQVRDIVDTTMPVLTDYHNYGHLVTHGVRPDRMIYVDFRKVPHLNMKVDLTLPFRISMLDKMF